MRLSPSSTPTSTAIGMVTLKKLGSMKRTTSTTLVNVELLRTTISRTLGNSFMKRMKVKITHPMSVWESISPRM